MHFSSSRVRARARARARARKCCLIKDLIITDSSTVPPAGNSSKAQRNSLSERKSNRRYCRGNGGGRGDSGGRNVGEAVEEEKVGNTPGTLLRTADAAAGIPDTPVAAALMGIPAVAELMDIPVADDVGGYRAIRNLEEGNSYWIGDGLKRVVEFGDI